MSKQLTSQDRDLLLTLLRARQTQLFGMARLAREKTRNAPKLESTRTKLAHVEGLIKKLESL